MRLEQRLQEKLELNLRPLPILVLEARILELPLLELEKAIIKEVETNPILKVPESDEYSINTMLNKSKYLSYEPELNAHPMGKYEDDTPSAEELLEAPPISVWDRLESQVSVQFSDGLEQKIARAILDNLDERGFLSVNEEELSKKVGTTLRDVKRIRRCFMELDPLGSGSLSISEFLLFQLLSRGLITEKEFGEFLEHLDERKIKEITGNMDISLLPYPFSLYEDTSSNYYIVPEVIFKVVEDRIVVEIYESIFTSLQINPTYEEMLRSEKTSREVKRFLAEKYRNAQKFREALLKRKEYIRRIADFIAEKQGEFLLGYVSYPSPVSQRAASSELGIPPSTLNRILKEKYADTPRGIFPLRFFFKRGVRGANFALSQEELAEIIREIIDSEDKRYPLSDEEIAAILNQRGIRIKRRTVAAKRSELGIPSSRERRRQV